MSTLASAVAARRTAPRCPTARAPAPGRATTCGWPRRSGTPPARRGAGPPARSSCRRRRRSTALPRQPGEDLLAPARRPRRRPRPRGARSPSPCAPAWPPRTPGVKSVCSAGPTVSHAWASAKASFTWPRICGSPTIIESRLGGHAEGVAHGVLVQVRVEQRLHGGRVDAAVPAEMAEDRRPRLARRLRDAVDLHAVARRERRPPRAATPPPLHVAQQLAQLVLLDGELLAQRDGRVPVAEAGDEERHQEPCRPGRKSPAPSVRTSAAKPDDREVGGAPAVPAGGGAAGQRARVDHPRHEREERERIEGEHAAPRRPRPQRAEDQPDGEERKAERERAVRQAIERLRARAAGSRRRPAAWP